ncbi:MAG: folylpolyglutamate synthase/dihydrofolate synthase family protein [Oscillospiraceae bacterium]
MDSTIQSIDYICNKNWQESRLGLSRVYALLESMGNPQNKLSFVHVAGTNGKGSCCAMTASILRHAGYKTGLYTSPFLHIFNERMQVDDGCISDEELNDITNFVREKAEALDDHPTEFELVTVIAFEYFMRHNCDIVVLEVGLGGRLDATNVISTTAVSVITNIGLDHTKELGNTLPLIAAEKAGIIKSCRPVVLYSQSAPVENAIKTIALSSNSPLYTSDPHRIAPLSHNLEGQKFSYKHYENLEIHLLGEHQLRNAATVIETIEVLRSLGYSITDRALREGLAYAMWPGRFEPLCRAPYFLVDGGHNPQCMESVAKNLELYFNGKKAVILTGVMADKDYAAMYDIIAPFAACFVAVAPDNSRALPAEKLAEFLNKYNLPVYTCSTVKAGIEKSLALCGEYDQLALAVGSLYMCGEIRTAFGFDIFTGLNHPKKEIL